MIPEAAIHTAALLSPVCLALAGYSVHLAGRNYRARQEAEKALASQRKRADRLTAQLANVRSVINKGLPPDKP